MPELSVALAALQFIGAFVGTACVVLAEWLYLRGMYKGQLDHAERRHVRAIGKALRFGMSFFLVGSIGSVIYAYAIRADTQPGLSATYWISSALALTVIFASLVHARSPKPSSLIFAGIAIGWAFLLIGATGALSSLSFGAAVAAYVVCAGVGYALIEYGRFLASPRHHHSRQA